MGERVDGISVMGEDSGREGVAVGGGTGWVPVGWYAGRVGLLLGLGSERTGVAVGGRSGRVTWVV